MYICGIGVSDMVTYDQILFCIQEIFFIIIVKSPILY
jgi:hypothetical protein